MAHKRKKEMKPCDRKRRKPRYAFLASKFGTPTDETIAWAMKEIEKREM